MGSLQGEAGVALLGRTGLIAPKVLRVTSSCLSLPNPSPFLACAMMSITHQLCALASNLGNFLRTMATPEPIRDWWLTSLQEELIKIATKINNHGRYAFFQVADVAILRHLFAAILRLIAELRQRPDPTPA